MRNEPARWILIAACSCQLSAQSAWSLIRTALPPITYGAPGCATDLAANRVLSFGCGATYDETWSWNGQTWQRLQTTNSPPARSGHGTAFDLGRNRLVIFGGGFGNGIWRNDTWEYDGFHWQQQSLAVSPPPRALTQMAYSPVTSRIVLFGGRTTNPLVTFGDTWEYDGVAWTQRTPQHSPPDRFNHGMAFVPANAKVLLFGGGQWLPVSPGLFLYAVVNDTWEWDGNDWAPVVVAQPPPARGDFAMCSDPLGGHCWIYGGADDVGLVRGDTWEWDGAEWAERLPSLAPAARSHCKMAFDPVNAGPVLLGGVDPTFLYQETWVLNSTPAVIREFGNGCTGSSGAPHLGARGAFTGRPMVLSLDHVPASGAGVICAGVSTWTFHGQPLPLNLTALGMPSCQLYVSLDFTQLFVGAQGLLNLQVQVPNRASLSGVTTSWQAFAFDAAANAAGATSSNGCSVSLAVP